jgi:hypothetical protein
VRIDSGESQVRRIILGLTSAAFITQAALAGTAALPQPIQVGDETGRYMRGVPVSSLELAKGAVTVTPLPMDHGSLAFAVIVYNDADDAANFDATDIAAEAGPQKLRSFTVDELEKAARSRAMWSQIGMAVLAGAAAAAVANAHTTSTSYGRVRTRHGSYSWASRYRDNSLGVVAATGAAVAGGVAISRIQDRLDATLDALDDEVIQRTTVEPQASYGGRIVLEKIRDKKQRDIRLSVAWHGETYTFAYRIPAKGEPAPAPLRTASGSSRIARGAMPAVLQVTPEQEQPKVTPAAVAVAPTPTI